MKSRKISRFLKREASKIKVDRSFQRKVCWSNKRCVNFIRCANMGRAPYPIVVADCESGLDKSEDYGDEFGKEKYSSYLKNGYKWVSLDGQNRIEAFRRLFDNELSISGIFKDADDVDVAVSNNTLFKDLSARLQDAFRDIEIEIKVQHEMRYRDLHEMFVDINSGESLNRQEIRNAINSPISTIIREISERTSVAEIWPEVYSLNDKKLKRSADAEWTARSFVYVHSDRELLSNPAGLDHFYNLGKGRKSHTQYSNVDRFNEIINMVSKAICLRKIHTGKNKIPIRQYWALLATMQYCFDNHIDVLDYSELYEVVYSSDKHLITKSKKRQAADLDGNIEESDSAYYWWWVSDPNYPSTRNKRRDELLKHLIKTDIFKKAAA
tara:strand:+ start:251 stop:1396 length:1146 start_codon:yes stop_codon:yes gene_type:complete